MLNVNSKYFNIAGLLHNALVVSVEELLCQKRYLPNVKLRYFNIAELLHNACGVMVVELLS